MLMCILPASPSSYITLVLPYARQHTCKGTSFQSLNNLFVHAGANAIVNLQKVKKVCASVSWYRYIGVCRLSHIQVLETQIKIECLDAFKFHLLNNKILIIHNWYHV